MIKDIKNKLENLKGRKIRISVDVGRNKNEEHDGYILDTYKNVWTFKTENGIKSYSYCDILIGQVILYE